MPDATILARRPERRAAVIALHCSGAGPGQWLPLAEALGPHCKLYAPSHFGADDARPWPGEHAFSLADEATAANAVIDSLGGKVHLVGHSYGGGVALHIATQRPDRVASLSLYEPSIFHLLKLMGTGAADAFAEIESLCRQTATNVTRGNYHGAAAAFIDYWGGQGAWEALRPSVQKALTRWAPKALLDFHALIEEPTTLNAYADLRMPVLLLRGEKAPAPTRIISEALAAQLPAASLRVVTGAGHMGPLTHTDIVAAAIARHVADVEAHLPSIIRT